MSSSSPTSLPSSDPGRSSPEALAREQQKQADAAAAQRFAEISLKSRPIPEGVDPNKRATLGEAVTTIKPDDFLKVHQAPCSREGLLTGIGSGGAIGFLRYIIGAPVPKAANWAVGSGIAVSILAYEYCQYQRRVERGNMKRVVEVVTKKQAEQKKLEEEKRIQQQQDQAASTLQKPGQQKSWYKFW
ncbi:hypothetical protein BD289DRAFT_451833 [Coniella lustricola]|uniref:Cytochrome c oxidase assembly protein COX20, mitochondrial n=1 Tax=Coniella lustricola TaxID=2025994 RepID=A0A2T3ADJ4_9PEZI|nr:hypothetical protein BD289DRAFT_451833 [Coniella lustricola]